MVKNTTDKFRNLQKFFAFNWFFCIIGFFLLIFPLAYVDEHAKNLSDILAFILIIVLLWGILSFLLAIFFYILDRESSDSAKKNKKIILPKLIGKGIVIMFIFPLYLLYRELKNLKGLKIRLIPIIVRIILLGLILLFFGFIWFISYFSVGIMVMDYLKLYTKSIPIVGTGSMYPTWPKGTKGKNHNELAKEIVSTAGFLPYPNGIVLGGRRFFGHTLGRGDIITWENKSTRNLTSQDGGDPTGLLKRLIGLSGDTIELKNGIVYLNGKPQKEPYTAKPHSTFGEKFLRECQVITVPKDKVFAMGDNRKGSADSREIGFVPIQDIDYVLPYKKQVGKLDKNYRDTNNDFNESTKIKLNKEKYLDLLNNKRNEAGAKKLKYQPLLEKSATKRGEIILKHNDFSFEATRSGYTMFRAMADSDYYNIVYGEAPQLGYYDAEELIENQFEFPETKKFLLNGDYQEIGISEVEGMLNGCPAQVLVQHFAGYVPPNYKKEDIESWKNVVNNLNSIIPSWEKAVGWKNLNQDDLKRLLNLLYRERNIATNILLKMDANKWLSKQEEDSIKEYESLANESRALADKLNRK